MVVNGSKKLLKVAPNFYCEICDYNTSKKSSFVKHMATDKHKNGKMVVNGSEKLLKVAQYKCWCGKMYKYDTGYYRHKKSCFEPELCQNIITDKDDPLDKDLIMMLVKQNSELLEVIKNGTNNTNTNNIINSHNKTFNLQFFLNETCKDAMNITDFVDSIKLQISDLEKVGELGYVEGISNIIVKNLKELDITQRPVHCTDKKRETIYIKDENKWEKDEEKEKIRRVIKKVASKNQRLLLKFKDIHPDCIKASSKYSDQYNKIIVESMGGSGNNDNEKEDKIIKKITSVTIIDKE
jgi:hypothetical protein